MRKIKTIHIQDAYGEEYFRHTINALKEKKYNGQYEDAIADLLYLLLKEDSIYHFLYAEMTTNDEVIIGDETLVGIDLMDYLP